MIFDTGYHVFGRKDFHTKKKPFFFGAVKKKDSFNFIYAAKYEKLGKFVDSFLLGFLVLLLVFDVVCLVMKAYGLIKFNAATFCNLCLMLSVAIWIISKAVLGKKTEN